MAFLTTLKSSSLKHCGFSYRKMEFNFFCLSEHPQSFPNLSNTLSTTFLIPVFRVILATSSPKPFEPCSWFFLNVSNSWFLDFVEVLVLVIFEVFLEFLFDFIFTIFKCIKYTDKTYVCRGCNLAD